MEECCNKYWDKQQTFVVRGVNVCGDAENWI